MALPAAYAGEVFLESQTEVRVRETDDGEVIAPLREYLSISLDAIGGSFVSVEAAGWGGTDLGGGEGGGDGDLTYGWVQLTGPDRLLRIGRQTASAGVAAELVDGAYGRAEWKYGLSAALFAGKPVPPDPDEGIGDLVFGGRVAQGQGGLYEVGLSYVSESGGDVVDRSLVGLDLRLSTVGTLRVAGRSDYDFEANDWARHAWRASLALPREIRLIGEFTWASYSSVFASSAFPAFASLVDDPEETMTAFGLGTEVPLGAGVTLTLRADSYGYSIAEDAIGFSGSVDWSGTVSNAGIAATRLAGGADNRSSTFARAWGATKRGRLSLSADCSLTAMDEAVNGTKSSVTGSVDGGWDFSPNLRLSGSVEFRSGPEMESEVRGGLTLVIRYGSTGRV
jgi:hypothetical protein